MLKKLGHWAKRRLVSTHRVLQKLGGARLKAVWMARAESMGGWGAVIVINQRSVIKDGMYEAEKELTYRRDSILEEMSHGGRIVLFMHSSSLASVRRRAWVTFLRSQGIDEQGDQPTIRSSAPDRAAVESHDVGAEERIGRSNRRNGSLAARGRRDGVRRTGRREDGMPES